MKRPTAAEIAERAKQLRGDVTIIAVPKSAPSPAPEPPGKLKPKANGGGGWFPFSVDIYGPSIGWAKPTAREITWFGGSLVRNGTAVVMMRFERSVDLLGRMRRYGRLWPHVHLKV
jgi:hypothetical protein